MYQKPDNIGESQFVQQKVGEKKDNRKVLVAVCGVCVALGIISLGVSGYQLSQTMALNAQMTSETTEVVVPLTDVSSRSDLVPSNFTLQPVPNKYIPSDAVKSLDEIKDSVSITKLTAGVPVSASCIQGASESGDLTASIKPDKVAVMLQLDEASMLNPLMHIGDLVDVYTTTSDGFASTTELIAEGVKIVALDGQTSGSIDTYTKVTVEVSDEQAKSIQADPNGVRLAANPRTDTLDAQAEGATDVAATVNNASNAAPAKNASTGGIDVQ